jgi:hypothetical protein
MGMNEELAEIYGTNSEPSPEDQLIEKIAADLSEEGVDIDDLSEDELAEVAEAYEAEEEGEEEGGEEGEEKTAAEEEFSNADTMGRIMAHSMWQELSLIKEAKKARKARKPMVEKGLLARLKEKARAGRRAVVKGLKKYPRTSIGAGLAAAGGAGYALGRREKKASALDALVEQKVVEVLEQLQ